MKDKPLSGKRLANNIKNLAKKMDIDLSLADEKETRKILARADKQKKVLSYACSMGFGPTHLARYCKHCTSKSCQCDCHKKKKKS